MPFAAKELVSDAFLNLMVEADSKAGKSQSIGASLAKLFGLIYIIECGTGSSLKPLQRVSQKFEYDLVRTEDELENAIRDARKGVKEGKYKALFLDDFNLYGMTLYTKLNRDLAGQSGQADGRMVWWEWRKRMVNTINRLMDIRAHFVMACHPASFMGKAGSEIPGTFSDVIYMTKDNKDTRVFLINSDAEPGRGSRSIQGEHRIEADIGVFWKLAQMPSEEQFKLSRQGQKSKESAPAAKVAR